MDLEPLLALVALVPLAVVAWVAPRVSPWRADMTHVSSTYAFPNWRFYEATSENTAAALAVENVGVTRIPGSGYFVLRVTVRETAGGSDNGEFTTLQASVNGGGYAGITTTTTGCRVATNPAALNHNATTTDRLSGSYGTFRGGRVVEGQAQTSSSTALSGNDHTEHIWCLEVPSGATPGTTVDFRLTHSGATLAAPTVPRVTVGSAAPELHSGSSTLVGAAAATTTRSTSRSTTSSLAGAAATATTATAAETEQHSGSSSLAGAAAIATTASTSRSSPAAAAGTVAYDALGSHGAGGAGGGSLAGSSITWQHTCAGADRVLLVGVTVGETGVEANGVLGATYAGQALTSLGRVGSGPNVGSSSGLVQLFALVDPPAGTDDVVVSWSGITTPDLQAGSISAAGVDPVDPFATPVTNRVGGATGITADVATVTGGLVVDAIVNGGPLDTFEQTLRWNLDTNTATGGGNGAMTTAAGTGGTVTMGGAGPIDNEWLGIIAVELLPATGAAGVELTGTAQVATTGTAATPEEHSGSSSLAGNAEVSSSPASSRSSSSSLEGAAQVATTATAPRSAAAALAGGAQIASTGRKDAAGPITLEGASSSDSDAQSARSAAAELTGAGEVTTTGTAEVPEAHSGSAVLEGTAAIATTATAGEVASGSADLQGDAEISATTAAPRSSSALLEGAAQVATAAAAPRAAVSSLAGNAEIATTASTEETEEHSGTAALAGAVAIATTATSIEGTGGSSSLEGAAAIATTAQVARSGQADVAGNAEVSTSAASSRSSSSSLEGAAQVAAEGTALEVVGGSSVIVGAAASSSTGSKRTTHAGSLAGAAQADAAATSSRAAASAIAGDAEVSATRSTSRTAEPVLAGAAAIATTAQTTQVGDGTRIHGARMRVDTHVRGRVEPLGRRNAGVDVERRTRGNVTIGGEASGLE